MFIIFFGLSTSKIYITFPSILSCYIYLHHLVVHMIQAKLYRMWWLFPTVCLCGVLEVIGWSAAVWSSFEPLLGAPFMMESV